MEGVVDHIATAVRLVGAGGMEAAIAEAEAEGFAVQRIVCTTAEGLIANLALGLRWQRNLGFTPAGLNLDALYDALHHEPSPERPRLALAFDAYDALLARDPRRAGLLPEVIAQRAAEIEAKGPLRLVALLPLTQVPAKV